ncbi:heme exporter protein CcmD [Pseudomarimonas salicorniae]|uniref:Heme exporter protein D n=1 Tax=Pseudomarimonas salicorniae TaxID=2933270 RepID=A0ABT0GL88_9GAMM|nr:heme exporter protein CcmD [Lysobacter sp. CAU 1642]MCK7595198.1 heme exporter protein CcmD [Lysobacter sp. CAU 1642]
MSDFWSMGGYGFYVWTSYALFLVLLGWDALAPRIRERAALRAAQARQRREAARQKT